MSFNPDKPEQISFEEWRRANPNIPIDLEDNPEQAWHDHMQLEAEIRAHQAELSNRTKEVIEFIDGKPDMPPDQIKARAREILGPDIMRWKNVHLDPDSVPEFVAIESAFWRIPQKPLGA